jgi:hypothetical protein
MTDKPNIWTSPKLYITKSTKSGNNAWKLHIDGIISRKYQICPVITAKGLLSLGIIRLIYKEHKNALMRDEAYDRGVSHTKDRITNRGILTYTDILNISDVLAEKKRNKMKTKYSTFDF